MNIRYPLLAVSFLISFVANGAEPPVPEGRRLRDIVADNFSEGSVYVGGTTGWVRHGREPGVILDREFSYVTPENDFKQGTINPEPGVWNWELADAWLMSCEKAGQLIRGHGPIGPQCGAWAMEDDRTAEELERSLVAFTSAFYDRYGNEPLIKWLDVVNETVDTDGGWLGPKPGSDQWENPWTLLGFDESHPLRPPLYIKKAFEIASERAGAGTELIINQNGSMEAPMWDTVKALALYLKEQGLRVDGIGWQAHVDVGWELVPGNLERLHALIDWCHSHGLSFHVTEMNAWLTEDADDFESQASTFAAVFGALLEHREQGEVSWNVWNISDRDAWRQEEMLEGCLFDRNYRAKPAYYSLQHLLENPPMARPAPEQ